MKNWIFIMLSLSLLFSGCARFNKQNSNLPTAQSPISTPVVERTEDSFPDPAPDFASMTFVEKNNLYIQLLHEKLDASLDTSAAENAYQKSLEASLTGDNKTADQALEEAILILWNL